MQTEILSAGDRLLLTAAAPDAFPTEALAPLLGEAFDWPAALASAASNRVASCVARLLESEPLSARIDADLRGRWRALWMLQVFRVEAAQRQLRELGSALAGAGIEALVYKGLDFQERVHPATHPRGFGDLDLIVRGADVPRAEAALVARGYLAPFDAPSLATLRRFHLHACYRHRAHRASVELHWALDSPFADAPDAVPLLFAAAERADALCPDLLRPSPIDALALMAVHLEKHLGICATLPSADARLRAVLDEGGLVWLLDVTLWMRRFSASVEGERLLQRMRELGAERALVIALRLAGDLDAAALPGWAAERAQRLPRGQSLLCRIAYPDLAAGLPVSARGCRRRAFLGSAHPRFTFRPLRVLEALLPGFPVPGTPTRSALARIALQARRLFRVGESALALRRDASTRAGRR